MYDHAPRGPHSAGSSHMDGGARGGSGIGGSVAGSGRSSGSVYTTRTCGTLVCEAIRSEAELWASTSRRRVRMTRRRSADAKSWSPYSPSERSARAVASTDRAVVKDVQVSPSGCSWCPRGTAAVSVSTADPAESMARRSARIASWGLNRSFRMVACAYASSSFCKPARGSNRPLVRKVVLKATLRKPRCEAPVNRWLRRQ